MENKLLYIHELVMNNISSWLSFLTRYYCNHYTT